MTTPRPSLSFVCQWSMEATSTVVGYLAEIQAPPFRSTRQVDNVGLALTVFVNAS